MGLPLVKNLHVEVEDYCFFTLVTIAPPLPVAFHVII